MWGVRKEAEFSAGRALLVKIVTGTRAPIARPT